LEQSDVPKLDYLPLAMGNSQCEPQEPSWPLNGAALAAALPYPCTHTSAVLIGINACSSVPLTPAQGWSACSRNISLEDIFTIKIAHLYDYVKSIIPYLP